MKVLTYLIFSLLLFVGISNAQTKKSCIHVPKRSQVKPASGSSSASSLLNTLIGDSQLTLYIITEVDTTVANEVGEYLANISYANACALSVISASGTDAHVVSCYSSLDAPTSTEGINVSTLVTSDLDNFLAPYEASETEPTGSAGDLAEAYGRNWVSWQILNQYLGSPYHGPSFPPDPWCDCTTIHGECVPPCAT